MALTGFSASDFLRQAAVVWPGGQPFLVSWWGWIESGYGGATANAYLIGEATGAHRRDTGVFGTEVRPFAEVVAASTGSANITALNGAGNEVWFNATGAWVANNLREVWIDGSAKVSNTTNIAANAPQVTNIGARTDVTPGAPAPWPANSGLAEMSVWDTTGFSTANRNSLAALLSAITGSGVALNANNINAQSGQPWTGALVAYWDMRELVDVGGGVFIVPDLSGNGHDLTVVGTLSLFDSHPPVASTITLLDESGAITFAGTQDTIEVPEVVSLLDQSGAITFAGNQDVIDLPVPSAEFYRETFTGPNGQNITDHTAESGHTYVLDSLGSGAMSIQANRLRSTSANTAYARAIGNGPGAPDGSYTIDFTLHRFSSVTQGRAGVFVTEDQDIESSLFVYWSDLNDRWECSTWTTPVDTNIDHAPAVGDNLYRAVIATGSPARIQLYVFDAGLNLYVLLLDSNAGGAGDKPSSPNTLGMFLRGNMGVSSGTHIAQAIAESPTPPTMDLPIFHDDFVGVDDDPPDSAKWPTVQVSAGSDASIQGDQLRLQTGGSGSVGDFEDFARLVASHASVTDCRVDFALTIPAEITQWFSLWSLRGNGLWATAADFPVFPRVGYWLQIAGEHAGAGSPVAFIGKAAPDGSTKVDLSGQGSFPLGNVTDDFFARFEVRDEGDVPVVGDPVLIDTAEVVTSHSSVVLTVGAGGVPAGATIFVDYSSSPNTTSGLGITDDGGNTYTPQVTQGELHLYRAFVATPLVSGDEITIVPNTTPLDQSSVVAYYVTGLANADAADSVVQLVSGAGPNATGPVTVPSGGIALVSAHILNTLAESSYVQDPNFTDIGSARTVPTLRRVDSSFRRVGGSVTYDPTFASGTRRLMIAAYARTPATQVRVLAAVRPQSEGPIPDGAWDIQAVDSAGTLFFEPGVLQIGLGGSENADELRTLLLDEITLFIPGTEVVGQPGVIRFTGTQDILETEGDAVTLLDRAGAISSVGTQDVVDIPEEIITLLDQFGAISFEATQDSIEVPASVTLMDQPGAMNVTGTQDITEVPATTTLLDATGTMTFVGTQDEVDVPATITITDASGHIRLIGTHDQVEIGDDLLIVDRFGRVHFTGAQDSIEVPEVIEILDAAGRVALSGTHDILVALEGIVVTDVSGVVRLTATADQLETEAGPVVLVDAAGAMLFRGMSDVLNTEFLRARLLDGDVVIGPRFDARVTIGTSSVGASSLT